jgi:hypothetical protein
MNCNCIRETEQRLAEFVMPQAGDDATATCMASGMCITETMGLRTVVNIPFRIKGSKKGFTSEKGKEMPFVASFCPFCGVSTAPKAEVPA